MKLVPIKRLRILCSIHLNKDHIADIVNALECHYLPAQGESQEFIDSAMIVSTEYLKYVDILLMSDGSIQIAHDQWIEERELLDYPESDPRL